MAKEGGKRSFEQAMGELEKIVQAIESGQVPLEEALAQYEKGIELISYCQKVLGQAEQKITQLSKGLDGELKVQDAPQLGQNDSAGQ